MLAGSDKLEFSLRRVQPALVVGQRLLNPTLAANPDYTTEY
jgi:hypothetical protein